MKSFFVTLFTLLAFCGSLFAQTEPTEGKNPLPSPASGAIKVKKETMPVPVSEGFEESDLDDPEVEKEASSDVPEVDPNQLELQPRDLVTNRDLLIGAIAGSFLGYGVGHAIQKRFYDGYGYAYTISQGIGYVLITAGSGSCRIGDGGCEDSKEGLVTAGAVLYLGSKLAEIFDVWIYYANNKDAVAQSKKEDVSQYKPESTYRLGFVPEVGGGAMSFRFEF